MSDTTTPEERRSEPAAGPAPPPPPPPAGGVAALSLEELGSSPPQISRNLYRKASQHNDQLSKAERLLLLSRRDLLGKALAYPDSLTEAQRDAVLTRPPPDVLAANIRHVTGLSTVAEVVHAFWSPTGGGGDRTAELSYAALRCITLDWWTPESEDRYRVEQPPSWADGPAHEAAVVLLLSARPEEAAFEAAVTKAFCDPSSLERMLPSDDASPDRDDEEGNERRRRSAEQALEVARLREELRAQLEEELRTPATGDDLAAAMRELRERMRVEVAQDAEEDARRHDVEAAERKRQMEELAEEKRRKRRRKAARKGGDGDDDDSDEGYVLSALVLNEG
ncbi:hypothetical protein QBC46DRAFT_317446 [Diplogelasinospora grovesii]|uniref:Uncharacterized protein n=1 Tax=Diplogelasinospora grovesii TaxID=303347 RepID=A0AAN6S2Y7_9PEZI|nr:hypothetical protein QBC46DRAFT_317446 [Diplogelasinospora grovesii]